MWSFSRYSIFLLILSVVFLVGIGLVMLASTSPWVEPEHMEYAHVKKQVSFLVIGTIGAVMAALIPFDWYSRGVWGFFAVAVILLILCYVPGVGIEVNGSYRWIKFPFLRQFQPSEPSKIVLTLMVAWWMVKQCAEPQQYLRGFFYPLLILSIPAALIFMEKDMGTTAVIIASAFLLLFVAGTRWWLLLSSAVLGVGGLIAFVHMLGGNRAARLLAFQDLEATKLDYGLQQWRSLLAFASGGVNGVGLGNGAEKHGYLPFAHTDFIFPIIGEELGLAATLAVILAFVLIAVAGLLIAQRAPDRFMSLVAVGLTANIVIPAAVNVGVATAMLPNTGLPLPLVSYGGTNLIFTLVSVGLLCGVYLRSSYQESAAVTTRRSRRIMRL